MTARRLIAVGALTAMFAVGGSNPAHADWIDDLERPTPEAIARSIKDLEPTVRTLDPRVRDIEPRIRDVVQQRTEGATKVIDLNTDLLFEFAKADVNPSAAARMPELLKPIPQGASVQVYGHTDGIGPDAANMQLSIDRANAAAAVIREARPDLQLDVQGFGETKPLAREGGDDDAEARTQNRRVEVRYQG